MATQARGQIRDQNLSAHFDVAPLGVKNNVSKAQKNGGGLGGRKALNDISNSSKTHISKNVISIGEEIGSSKPISSFGSKRNVSKAPEKVQAGGRKALSDLTNSGKPYVQQSSNDGRKKLGTVVEEQILSDNISGEQLLHNHQECIKAQQQKGIDIDYFLHTVGLENDDTMQLASPRASLLSSKLKVDSPPRYLEIEEMSELQWNNTGLPSGQASPSESPKSPKPCAAWMDYDFPSFTLRKSPNH